MAAEVPAGRLEAQVGVLFEYLLHKGARLVSGLGVYIWVWDQIKLRVKLVVERRLYLLLEAGHARVFIRDDEHSWREAELLPHHLARHVQIGTERVNVWRGDAAAAAPSLQKGSRKHIGAFAVLGVRRNGCGLLG